MERIASSLEGLVGSTYLPLMSDQSTMEPRRRSDRCGLAQSWAAGAIRVERFRLDRTYRKRAHAHAHRGVALIVDGAFRARTEGRTWEAEPGTALVLPRGWSHAEDTLGRGVDCLLLSSAPSASTVQRPPPLQPRETPAHARVSAGPRVELLVQELCRSVLGDGGPPSARFVQECVAQLLVDTEAATSQVSSVPRWLDQARGILEGDPTSSVSVAEVADQVGVTREHLAREFRAAFGEAPSTARRRARLRLARRLLVADDSTVSAVAQQAGFADHSHLTRSFRAAFGVTPQMFRSRGS